MDSKEVVLYFILDPDLGLYLGSSVGTGHWTGIECKEDDNPAVFKSTEDIVALLEDWDEPRPKAKIIKFSGKIDVDDEIDWGESDHTSGRYQYYEHLTVKDLVHIIPVESLFPKKAKLWIEAGLVGTNESIEAQLSTESLQFEFLGSILEVLQEILRDSRLIREERVIDTLQLVHAHVEDMIHLLENEKKEEERLEDTLQKGEIDSKTKESLDSFFKKLRGPMKRGPSK